MCVGTYCSDVAYLPTFVWGYNLASLISERQDQPDHCVRNYCHIP